MARYYNIDSANERLFELRPLLEQLKTDRDAVAALQAELQSGAHGNGNGNSGADVGEREETIREVVRRMERAVARIDGWDVSLRDIEHGLVDFPAMASGRPIWLCWRLGEPAIEWWHEMSTGFAGRKPLAELT